MSLLDPNGTWFWLLYTLAGAGVAVALMPVALNQATQLERDTYRAQPVIMATAYLVFWTLWPLFVLYLLVGSIWIGMWNAYYWVTDRFKGDS